MPPARRPQSLRDQDSGFGVPDRGADGQHQERPAAVAEAAGRVGGADAGAGDQQQADDQAADGEHRHAAEEDPPGWYDSTKCNISAMFYLLHCGRWLRISQREPVTVSVLFENHTREISILSDCTL